MIHCGLWTLGHSADELRPLWRTLEVPSKLAVRNDHDTVVSDPTLGEPRSGIELEPALAAGPRALPQLMIVNNTGAAASYTVTVGINDTDGTGLAEADGSPITITRGAEGDAADLRDIGGPAGGSEVRGGVGHSLRSLGSRRGRGLRSRSARLGIACCGGRSPARTTPERAWPDRLGCHSRGREPPPPSPHRAHWLAALAGYFVREDLHTCPTHGATGIARPRWG